MKQVQGVLLETVLLHEEEVPAFVFPESRAKQWLATVLSLCTVVVCLLVYVKANSWAPYLPTHSPVLVRLGSLFVALVFGAAGVMKAQELRGGQGYLALLPQGVYRLSVARTYLIPWEAIEEVAPFYTNATAFLGIRVMAPERVESAQSLTKFMKSNRSTCGWDFAYGLPAFQVHPTWLATAAQASLHLPQLRAEIGTAEGLLAIQRLVEQRWQPDLITEPEGEHADLFAPDSHPELLNEELQRAIEAVAEDNTASSRRTLYQVLLETTFCLPSEKSNESTSHISLSQTPTGELALAAFSDPAALRRWDANAGAMLVMPAAQLFSLAIEHDCAQILINPAGPSGGKLDRSDFVLLAQGVMPD